MDNEQLKAAMRAQLLDVQASRSRIVEAGDRERRRVDATCTTVPSNVSWDRP